VRYQGLHIKINCGAINPTDTRSHILELGNLHQYSHHTFTTTPNHLRYHYTNTSFSINGTLQNYTDTNKMDQETPEYVYKAVDTTNDVSILYPFGTRPGSLQSGRARLTITR